MKKVLIYIAALIVIYFVVKLFEYDKITPEEQRLYYEYEEVETSYDYEEVGTSTPKKSTNGVYTFSLTEVNGRKIEGVATFTANTPINRFELKVDGETFYYTPTGKVGNDPLCGITATDKFGRSTAICVEIITRSNVKIRVWNSGQRFNFKGHAAN